MLRSVRRAAVTLLLAGLFAASAVLVATPAAACDCATAFTRAFLCGGSAPWTAELDAELAALAGPPAGPEATSDPLPGDAGLAPAGSSPLLPVLAGVGAVVVLAGGVVLLLRRRLRGRR